MLALEGNHFSIELPSDLCCKMAMSFSDSLRVLSCIVFWWHRVEKCQTVDVAPGMSFDLNGPRSSVSVAFPFLIR